MSLKLDHKVAKKVMGWNIREDTMRIPEIGFTANDPEPWYEYAPGSWIPLPPLSSSISSAFLVVEKLDQPFYLEFSEGEWFAMFGDDLGNSVKAPTAPEAICRAGLAYVSAREVNATEARRAALKAVDNGRE